MFGGVSVTPSIQLCIILFSVSELRLDSCNTMPKTNLELYREYHELYGRANPNLSKKKAHDEVNAKWNSMKKEGKFDLQAYNTEISALKSKLTKRKLTMFDFLILTLNFKAKILQLFTSF